MWFESWTPEGLAFQFVEDVVDDDIRVNAVPVEFEVTDPDNIIALPNGQRLEEM